MAQRLACRAEDREVLGSSPTPRQTFNACSHYQLNQLGSKAASESTFKWSNTCGASNILDFTIYDSKTICDS